MKALVTGAGGQIGADLLAALAKRGCQVVATDLAVPREVPTHGGTHVGDAAWHTPDVPAWHTLDVPAWHTLDVIDRDQVHDAIATARPDVVFHLAAILSARGERSPQHTYDVNQTGTYHVLEACRQHGVGQLVFTSSIAVYGPGLPDPTPDDVPLHPTTMYGVTKASNELLADYYRQRYRLDVRGVRFPGLISATLPGGGTSDYALYMYTDGIGNGAYEAFCRPDTRIPLMYMPDGIRALDELAAAPRDALTRCIYNVAAFSPTAREIAESVARAIGEVNITFEPVPARQAILDSWPNQLDDAIARRDWGWQPAWDLERMTADLVPRIRALLAERADAFERPDTAEH